MSKKLGWRRIGILFVLSACYTFPVAQTEQAAKTVDWKNNQFLETPIWVNSRDQCHRTVHYVFVSQSLSSFLLFSIPIDADVSLSLNITRHTVLACLFQTPLILEKYIMDVASLFLPHPSTTGMVSCGGKTRFIKFCLNVLISWAKNAWSYQMRLTAAEGHQRRNPQWRDGKRRYAFWLFIPEPIYPNGC